MYLLNCCRNINTIAAFAEDNILRKFAIRHWVTTYSIRLIFLCYPFLHNCFLCLLYLENTSIFLAWNWKFLIHSPILNQKRTVLNEKWHVWLLYIVCSASLWKIYLLNWTIIIKIKNSYFEACFPWTKDNNIFCLF